MVWASATQMSSDYEILIRGARILGSGTVLDQPDGFVIGAGAHVTGVMATGGGYTVLGGAATWIVSANALTITPAPAIADVPRDLSMDVNAPANPLAFLVAGGPRPLIVYQKPADGQHDVPYFVGTLPPVNRVRALRP